MSEDEDFIVDELPASRRKRRTAGGAVQLTGFSSGSCCRTRRMRSQEYRPDPHTGVHSPAVHRLQLGTLFQSGISP